MGEASPNGLKRHCIENIYLYIYMGINNIALLSALDRIWNKETCHTGEGSNKTQTIETICTEYLG